MVLSYTTASFESCVLAETALRKSSRCFTPVCCHKFSRSSPPRSIGATGPAHNELYEVNVIVLRPLSVKSQVTSCGSSTSGLVKLPVWANLWTWISSQRGLPTENFLNRLWLMISNKRRAEQLSEVILHSCPAASCKAV